MKTQIKKNIAVALYVGKQRILIMYLSILLLAFGCKKSNYEIEKLEHSENLSIVKEKLKAAGFDLSEGFSATKDGYMVEYDIFVSKENINNLGL